MRATLALGLALAGAAAGISLGNWQLRRAAERDASASAWEAAREAAPLVLRASGDLDDVARHLPRRVRAVGRFEHDRTVWLDNRPLDGRAGFLVATPMRLATLDAQVWVIRGWAPRDPGERTRLPEIGRPAGPVEIEGIAVAHAPRLFEFGAGAGERGPIRQNLDPETASPAGPPLAPFVVQQTSSLPDSLERRVVAPASGAERNRAYAVQWFALAGLCGVLAAAMGVHFFRSRHTARTTA